MISIKDGDLLTNPRLHGNLYLKTLLLGESTSDLSASRTNRPLKFGYNFASGTTNRERQSVVNTREESRHILAIWSKVLAAKPEMVSELSGMLNTAEPRHFRGRQRAMVRGQKCRECAGRGWYHGGGGVHATRDEEAQKDGRGVSIPAVA